MHRTLCQSIQESEGDNDLSPKDFGRFKRYITNMLKRGEIVLQALLRAEGLVMRKW